MFKVITNIEELKGKEIKYIELANITDDENIIITKDNCVFIQNLDVEDEWCVTSNTYNKEKLNEQLILCNGNNYLSRLFIREGLIIKDELNNLIKNEKEIKAKKELEYKKFKNEEEYREYLRLKEKFERKNK